MRRLLLLLTLVSFLIPAMLPAQGGAAQDLGTLRPKSLTKKMNVFVAMFNIEGDVSMTPETMPRIIRRDLELNGQFQMLRDQDSGNRQNRLDARGSIDFNAWRQMQVDAYVMGRMGRVGDKFKARIILYEVQGGTLIFDRIFEDTVDQERRLAHRISDEIVLYLTGTMGVASTKILYIGEQVPGVKEVFVMDADGFQPRRLTNYNNITATPEWGMNGGELFFTSYHGNRANVYGMQLSTGKTWPVAAYGGTNHSPAWNDRIQRLGMVLSKDGNSEIYTSRRDGSDLKRLTSTKHTEGSPAWSPDGAMVAFTSNEAGGVHLFVMSADGSNRRRITKLGAWNDAVSWSPKGDRLVFVARNGGANDVYLCDVKGGGDLGDYRRLTQRQGQNESPSWAPDGRHVIFSSNRSGQWQVYMMLDDGTNQQQLTTTGRNTQPSWGPMPVFP